MKRINRTENKLQSLHEMETISPNLDEIYSVIDKKITDLTNMIRLSPVAKRKIIDINEASALTGYKKSYIYKLIHLKQIPHYKMAKGKNSKVFFKIEEIYQWLESNRIPTDDELQSLAIENLRTAIGGREKKKGAKAC